MRRPLARRLRELIERGRSLDALVVLIWVFAVAAFVLLVAPRERTFLVEARAERLEVRGLGLAPGGSWDVSGFCLAVDAPLLSDAPEAACAAPPRGARLQPADGATAEIERLGTGALRIRIAAPEGAGEEGALATLLVPEAPEEVLRGSSLRLVHPPRADGDEPVEIDFGGWATLGVLPEDRARGILLEGKVTGSVAGWLGAGRYEVLAADLARGDVATMRAGRRWLGLFGPGECDARVRGFVRLPPGAEEGLLFTYVGCADALRIDRVAARFELVPTWAMRLLRDPLLLALAAVLGLLTSIKAVTEIVKPRRK